MPTNPRLSEEAALMYAVTATLPDEPTAMTYFRWLADGHVQQVIQGGATSARIVRLDSEADQSPQGGAVAMPRIETQYRFPGRAAFDRYVRDVAPGLRADGLTRFPASLGVHFERRVGLELGFWRA